VRNKSAGLTNELKFELLEADGRVVFFWIKKSGVFKVFFQWFCWGDDRNIFLTVTRFCLLTYVYILLKTQDFVANFGLFILLFYCFIITDHVWKGPLKLNITFQQALKERGACPDVFKNNRQCQTSEFDNVYKQIRTQIFEWIVKKRSLKEQAIGELGKINCCLKFLSGSSCKAVVHEWIRKTKVFSSLSWLLKLR
jgi:hypothetical protein